MEGPANAETFAWPAAESPAQLDALDHAGARRVTRHVHDPVTGELTSTTRPDGSILSRSYDPAGRISEILETGAPPATGTAPERLVARYDYSIGGQVAHEWSQWISPVGTVGEVVVDRTWTPTGQLASETDPHLDSAGPSEISTRSFAYSAAGQLTTVTDALGHQVTYDHQLGRRVRRDIWNPAATAVVSTQTWAYTRDGKVASASVPHAPGTSAPAGTSFTYDDQGRTTLVVDASGRSSTTSYTNNGQPATVTWATGPSDATPTTASFSYDGAGRRIAASGSLGAYSWAFDRVGRLVSASRPDATGTATDAWRWDLAGNRVWYRHDNGRRVRSDWDQMGRLTGVSVDLAVEPGTPIWLPIATYGRSGFGETVRESTWALADTGQRLWGRDLTGRVVTYDQSVRQANGTWSSTDTTLGWRPDGRLASDTTVGQAGWAYDYDAAGQLIEADPDTGATLTWGYGIAGQRTTATTAAGTTTSTWDAGTSLLTGTSGPEGTVAYTYDAAGRRTTRTLTPPTGPAQTTTSAYDDRGRLATATTGAATASRGYDIDGRLTTSISGGLTYTATWDPTTPIPEMVELEVAGQHINYGIGESRLWTDQNGTPTWNAFDVHGSAIDTPDTTAPTSYDPYGIPTPALTSGFGYRDELTLDGLVHLRNRDYDPTTGTFTTPDPLDSIDGTPTVGNPHHYSDNDPLNKTDPLGLRPDDGDLGPCPDDFLDFGDVGACAIGPSFGDGDEEFAYLGTQPLALTCSHSQIPQPKFDLFDLQDGDVNVDCTVIFSKKATGSLSLLMGIEGSRTRVIQSLCGERSIEVGGLSIDIDPNLVQGQINEHLSALGDLGIDTSCVPFSTRPTVRSRGTSGMLSIATRASASESGQRGRTSIGVGSTLPRVGSPSS